MTNPKFETRNSKYQTCLDSTSSQGRQILNSKYPNTKLYDLEVRTLEFGKGIIKMCKSLPKNYINLRLGDQCLRSGTSIGANYREANEAETKKDFKNKIRISKKEAKETIYWLKLIIYANPQLEKEISPLLEESKELMKILGAIYERSRS